MHGHISEKQIVAERALLAPARKFACKCLSDLDMYIDAVSPRAGEIGKPGADVACATWTLHLLTTVASLTKTARLSLGEYDHGISERIHMIYSELGQMCGMLQSAIFAFADDVEGRVYGSGGTTTISAPIGSPVAATAPGAVPSPTAGESTRITAHCGHRAVLPSATAEDMAIHCEVSGFVRNARQNLLSNTTMSAMLWTRRLIMNDREIFINILGSKDNVVALPMFAGAATHDD